MRVDLYPELIEILSAAKDLVGRRRFFLWKNETEPDPESVDFSFRPVIAEKIVERTLDKSACTLCPRRISYKKGQFTTEHPQYPYLFLVHNDFLGPRAAFYHKPEENSLFERMLERVLGFTAGQVLVREILRCHFSKEDTGDATALANCYRHVRHDIEAHGIRGIVLVGQAASFVFPDKTELSGLQNRVFSWQGVETMVLPGPNRLVYMREKGFPSDQIDSERKKIFAALQLFRDKIIGAGQEAQQTS